MGFFMSINWKVFAGVAMGIGCAAVLILVFILLPRVGR